MAEPLLRLAALAGVQAAFRDIFGAERQVAEDDLHAVLAAMGHPNEDDAAVAREIAILEAEPWRALLPPAIVIHEDTAPSIAFVIPDRLNAGRVLWSLQGEDTHADGSADLHALETLASIGDGHERHRRLALPLPRLAPGYYCLSLAAGHESAETSLIVVPTCGYLPPQLADGRRAWGLSAQLYSLRSERNWGMGDYADLSALAGLVAGKGAATLGLNPLHALYPAEPRHISPYSPSSRLFLNPLYLDVEAMPDLAACEEARAHMAGPEFRATLGHARASDLVDHTAVAAAKQPLFALLYAAFAAHHLAPLGAATTARGADFRRFQREGGVSLRDYGRFNALHEGFYRAGCASWHDWPAPFRRANSDAVAEFAREHEAAVELHQYLEWESCRQLDAAAARAAAAGLGLGLYRDLAVGVDPSGAGAWADPDLLVSGATIGAPPDLLNLKGQNWGLAPPNPTALRRRAYEPFIAALRANMRGAGVLRIDHVMAMQQLYWIPRGTPAGSGAYVSYPLRDLLGIIALESQRNRCLVIGEDLGTVPEGFTRTLNDCGILSYRLLMFEKEGERFRAPRTYPRAAAATFSSHDLPTMRGFWLGADIAWRRKLDLYPDAPAAVRDEDCRRQDRRELLALLMAEGLIDESAAARLLPRDDDPVFALELVVGLHRLLGRANSALALMSIEDAAGEVEQANIPGTVDEHPNWRRRLGKNLAALASDADFAAIAAALCGARKE
ncbi:MAG TPA: 4-alpha-glucanotransferase [Stellaceae bacterium]|nr:4-alpha-glucanotransferase [Stellaceae bacterium]